jgi:hypothetical protein
VGAESLDVVDQVIGRVRRQIHGGITGMWGTPPGPALVEEHDAIRRRIEKATHSWRASRTRTSVQHERRLATWVPARLPVEGIAFPDIEHSGRIWLEMRIGAHHHRSFSDHHPGRMRVGARLAGTYP